MKAVLGLGRITQLLKQGIRGWESFWFYSQAPERMTLFRVLFGLLLLAIYGIRTLDLELFFSERGIMPLSSVRDIMPMDYRYSLLFFFTSTQALWIFHLVLLGALGCMVAGILPRLMAAIALAVNISFLHRNMMPTYGVDMISCFFLFYLAIGATPRKGYARESARGVLSSMGFRLLQLQVCIIYMYAGLDKARGPQWWGGEALWGVLTNVQLARVDFSFMAHLPLVLVLATYSTLFWEIYFPALVWMPKFRRPVLWFGVALHLGIAFTVNLPFFGALMIFSYVSFVEEAWAAQVLDRARAFVFRRAARGSQAAPAAAH